MTEKVQEQSILKKLSYLITQPNMAPLLGIFLIITLVSQVPQLYGLSMGRIVMAGVYLLQVFPLLVMEYAILLHRLLLSPLW